MMMSLSSLAWSERVPFTATGTGTTWAVSTQAICWWYEQLDLAGGLRVTLCSPAVAAIFLQTIVQQL
jgi:hypothetical protein